MLNSKWPIVVSCVFTFHNWLRPNTLTCSSLTDMNSNSPSLRCSFARPQEVWQPVAQPHVSVKFLQCNPQNQSQQ